MVIIIGISERYEYSSPLELDAFQGNYFIVPSSIILKSEANEKRVTVFSFFSVRRGLDLKLLFSVNNIVSWSGKQPNRHSNGINNKIIQAIEYLKGRAYLTFSGEITNATCIEAEFNLSKIS